MPALRGSLSRRLERNSEGGIDLHYHSDAKDEDGVLQCAQARAAATWAPCGLPRGAASHGRRSLVRLLAAGPGVWPDLTGQGASETTSSQA